MTQDEIIEMARQAGLYTKTTIIQSAVPLDQMLEAFAKLVAAKEREACAKVCEKDAAAWGYDSNGASCAIAIRARGDNQ